MVAPSVAPVDPKIEVTLESIQGITAEISSLDFGDVTASVAFAGSAPSMKVSSFTMCSRTGKLVVESNFLQEMVNLHHSRSDGGSSVPIPSDDGNSNPPGDRKQHFRATFNDPMEGRRSFSSSSLVSSSSTTSSSSRPHLQLRLSPDIIASQSECDSERSTRTANGPLIGDKDTSLDIVELKITLRNPDYSICTEGTAHIFLGREKRKLGSTTMDLPIHQCLQEHASPFLGFSDNASIRLQLKVTSAHQPSASPGEITLSDNLNEKEIEGLMNRLKEHEERAETKAKASTPKDTPDQRSSRRVFCSSGLDLAETVKGIVDVLTRCDRRPQKSRKSRGFFPILRSNSTMDSTIETRDSLII